MKYEMYLTITRTLCVNNQLELSLSDVRKTRTTLCVFPGKTESGKKGEPFLRPNHTHLGSDKSVKSPEIVPKRCYSGVYINVSRNSPLDVIPRYGICSISCKHPRGSHIALPHHIFAIKILTHQCKIALYYRTNKLLMFSFSRYTSR